MATPPIKLQYGKPSEPPKGIVIRTYSDGGVTVIVPQPKVNGIHPLLFAGMFFVGLMTPIIHVSLQYIPAIFVIFAIAMATAVFVLAVIFLRTTDSNMIIAISPKAIHIKPPNRKRRIYARKELKSIEVITSRPGISPHILFSFFHHYPRRVCKGRKDFEIRTVAQALLKARDATIQSPPC